MMADEPKKEEAKPNDLLGLWGKEAAKEAAAEKPNQQPLSEKELPQHKPVAEKIDQIQKQTEPVKEKAVKQPALEGEIAPLPFVESAAEEKPQMLDERGESQFSEFLEELNLSKQHVFYAIGCFVLFIILIAGGIWGYRYFKNRRIEEPKQTQEPAATAAQVDNEATGVVSTEKVGEPASINPQNVGDTGIEAVVSIGETPIKKSGIASYIFILRRLKNAYEVDVNQLLDQATDRRGRLRSHVAFLRGLSSEGTQTLQSIKADMEVLKTEYEAYAKDQSVADENFFENLNALNAQTSEEVFENFIRSTNLAGGTRSRFKALSKIRSLYEKGLPRMANRIRDIELNEAPLVSGIKVYDVKGSDLQLIVPADSEVVPEERLTSPGFPLIPVSPSEVKIGKDYITQPGGGFR